MFLRFGFRDEDKLGSTPNPLRGAALPFGSYHHGMVLAHQTNLNDYYDILNYLRFETRYLLLRRQRVKCINLFYTSN
jgi:hypothetical protein